MSRSASMRMPVPGETIAGKYRIERIIGEGGMGRVFEASHVRLRHRVAVKVLPPEAAHDADAVVRFEREARAAAHLKGLNVARVIDVDVLESGLPYMVLELLVGRDLEAELGEIGPLSIEDGVDFVSQAAAAMSEAHQAGIVHRDLKPSNLFLCDVADSKRKLVKVLDFGISKFVADEGARMTSAHSTFGTAYYMSPEQVRSVRDVDARADVWSLGVILYELLTGKPPFEGTVTAVAAAITADVVPKPSARRPAIPLALEEVILKALVKDRDGRFQTTADLRAALAPFGPSVPIEEVIADRMRISVGTPAAAFSPVGVSVATPNRRIVLAAPARAPSHDAPTAAPWSSNPPALPSQAVRRRTRGRFALAASLVVAALVGIGFVIVRETSPSGVGSVAPPSVSSPAVVATVAPSAAASATEPSASSDPTASAAASSLPAPVGASARRTLPQPPTRPTHPPPSATSAPATAPTPPPPRNPTHI